MKETQLKAAENMPRYNQSASRWPSQSICARTTHCARTRKRSHRTAAERFLRAFPLRSFSPRQRGTARGLERGRERKIKRRARLLARAASKRMGLPVGFCARVPSGARCREERTLSFLSNGFLYAPSPPLLSAAAAAAAARLSPPALSFQFY